MGTLFERGVRDDREEDFDFDFAAGFRFDLLVLVAAIFPVSVKQAWIKFWKLSKSPECGVLPTNMDPMTIRINAYLGNPKQFTAPGFPILLR